MSISKDAESIAWADVAKFACVCLVVLMHGEAQIAPSGWYDYPKIIHVWHTVNEFIRPIRMPTFFLISGMLASKYVMHVRKESDNRCFTRPMYLYILWALVLAMLVPNYPDIDFNISLAERLHTIFYVGSPAWFMYGLGIFYLIAKVTRSLPPRTVLIACALVSLCGSIWLPGHTYFASRLVRCLFFFVAGVRLKDIVIDFANRASPRRNLALFALYALGAVITAQFETYFIAVDMVAVAFSLTTWCLLCRNLGTLAQPVQWLGRRTLFVYVLHFPLFALLSEAVSLWAGPEILQNFWLGLAYPVIAVALLVPLSLALGLLLQRMGLHMLFELPSLVAPKRNGKDPLPT